MSKGERVRAFFEMRPEVRQPFAYDADGVSRETALSCPEETLTVQADAEQCDINVLVRQFGVMSDMPVGNPKVPLPDEFYEITDFQSAMNKVREAEEAFMAMPAEVRAEMGHDPGKFVAFAADPANLDRMRKWGLAPPAPVPPSVPPKTDDSQSPEPPAPKA